MTLTIAELWYTVVLSLRTPKQGGERVLGWKLPKEAIGPFVGINLAAKKIKQDQR